MGRQTEYGIPWCDFTFNPWIGCTKISPGCDNCYAESIDSRLFGGGHWGANAERLIQNEQYWQKPYRWNLQAARKGNRPRVFCGSMCDVFDTESPEDIRDNLFRLISDTEYLIWILLTKRIGNALKMFPDKWRVHPPHNVWIGATVCNNEEAARDIPKLERVPTAIRFLSIEPMLGPVDVWNAVHPPNKIDWIIVGGESGPRARPLNLDWVRSIRDQCKLTGVPFFFKQGSQTSEWKNGRKFKDINSFPDDLQIREFPTR